MSNPSTPADAAYSPVRKAILDMLIDSSWTVRDIAGHLQAPMKGVRVTVDEMLAEGLIRQAQVGRYTSSARPFVYKRPAPIQMRILDALGETRRASEIASAIGMPIASVTPHLAFMANRNMIVRVRRGVYSLPVVEANGQRVMAL